MYKANMYLDQAEGPREELTVSADHFGLITLRIETNSLDVTLALWGDESKQLIGLLTAAYAASSAEAVEEKP